MFPETWQDKAFDFNARVFDHSLAYTEVKRTIESARRRDYRYKCKQEPCQSLCDSAACIKRKYGITDEEKGVLEVGGMPTFTG